MLLVLWSPTEVSLSLGTCPEHVHWCSLDSGPPGSGSAETQLFLSILRALGWLLCPITEDLAVAPGHTLQHLGLLTLTPGFIRVMGSLCPSTPPLLMGDLAMPSFFPHTQHNCAGSCEAALWSASLGPALSHCSSAHTQHCMPC